MSGPHPRRVHLIISNRYRWPCSRPWRGCLPSHGARNTTAHHPASPFPKCIIYSCHDKVHDPLTYTPFIRDLPCFAPIPHAAFPLPLPLSLTPATTPDYLPGMKDEPGGEHPLPARCLAQHPNTHHDHRSTLLKNPHHSRLESHLRTPPPQRTGSP
jgi:hypothetical protein